MFNLGFSEIVIIGVLALLLIGPKQLPEMARVLGRMMNEFKKATSDLSGGLLEIKNELQRPMKEGMESLARIQEDVKNAVLKEDEPNRPEEAEPETSQDDKTVKIDMDELRKTHTTGETDGRES